MVAALAAHRTEGFALGTALSAFDAAATWMWITMGLATEANPVMANLVHAQGATTAMAVRALLGVVWFASFRLLSGRSRLAGPAHYASLMLLGGLSAYHVSHAVRLFLG